LRATGLFESQETTIRKLSGARIPVGRPHVSATPEQVQQLRSEGISWRKIAKVLGIGTATAMRLFRSR
jgi:hypothetical protein